MPKVIGNSLAYASCSGCLVAVIKHNQIETLSVGLCRRGLSEKVRLPYFAQKTRSTNCVTGFFRKNKKKNIDNFLWDGIRQTDDGSGLHKSGTDG